MNRIERQVAALARAYGLVPPYPPQAHPALSLLRASLRQLAQLWRTSCPR